MPKPLRWLVLDLNGFFASCEQHDRPRLRGRPVGVAPIDAEATCVIAASAEAKACGVKCGVKVSDARVMCPGIEIVSARPKVYVAYNQRIKELMAEVLPIHKELSIDEMSFRLLGVERQPSTARRIAQEMKGKLRDEFGPSITASIGVAPNAFLAKTGTDMEKRDGLVILQAEDLPERLYTLELTDLCGINRRMKLRFNAAGIFTVKDLCGASRGRMRRIFGSLIGEEWYYLLQGCDVPDKPTERSVLGHSHVLPIDLRNREGAREVLFRLLQKATARMRAEGFYAGGLYAYVKGEPSWERHGRIAPSQENLFLNRMLVEWFAGAEFGNPKQAAVGFYDLRTREALTPSLFDDVSEPSVFGGALDDVNKKFGKHAIYLGAIHGARDAADEKIAFGKTELFVEGKGDHAFTLPRVSGDPPPVLPSDPANEFFWSDDGDLGDPAFTE